MMDDALSETGNIILNGCLGSIANLLQHRLAVSVPEVIRGDGSFLFQVAEDCSSERAVLFLYGNFSIRSRDLRGYIAIVMDLPSLTALKETLNEFINQALGTDA